MKRISALIAGMTAMVLLALFCQSCSDESYERTDNGIVVRLGDKAVYPGQAVRLSVVTDKIIRVTAVPSGEFSETQSLMALPLPENKVEFTIEKGDGTITLSTSTVSAQVSLTTGEVVFTDNNGTVFLAEQTGGGKSFSPVTVGGETYFAVCQQFESPQDEALYGLGANQTSFMNLKGKDADLFQYNTMAVIPFIVSNHNYGILWDNNSRTKFGDVRDWTEHLPGHAVARVRGPGGRRVGWPRVRAGRVRAASRWREHPAHRVEHRGLPAPQRRVRGHRRG